MLAVDLFTSFGVTSPASSPLCPLLCSDFHFYIPIQVNNSCFHLLLLNLPPPASEFLQLDWRRSAITASLPPSAIPFHLLQHLILYLLMLQFLWIGELLLSVHLQLL